MKTYSITVNGKTYGVSVEETGASSTPAAAPKAAPAAAPKAASAPAPQAAPAAAPADGTPVNSPIPGTILDIKVANGASVTKGQVLCILEAMKMENEIVSPIDGKIASINTTKGASVNSGDLLFVVA